MILIKNIVKGSDSTHENNDYHTKTLPFLSIAQSKNGQYSISIDGGIENRTDDGGFFIAPPFVGQQIAHHPFSSDKELEIRWIFIDVKIDDVWDISRFFEFPVTISAKNGAKLNQYFDELWSIKTKDPTVYQIKSHRICFMILDELIEMSKPVSVQASKKIYPALSFLELNYMTNPSTKDLAGLCSISESYFLKLFSSGLGISPLQYIKMLKLKQSIVLLNNTKLPISEISDELGFYDQFHFSREFKKMYGVSPVAYRNHGKREV